MTSCVQDPRRAQYATHRQEIQQRYTATSQRPARHDPWAAQRRGPSPLDILRADNHWCRDRLPSCRAWKPRCFRVKCLLCVLRHSPCHLLLHYERKIVEVERKRKCVVFFCVYVSVCKYAFGCITRVCGRVCVGVCMCVCVCVTVCECVCVCVWERERERKGSLFIDVRN